MPEKPPEGKDALKESENLFREKCETKEQQTWSEDQRKKSYYYDDAYGYEIYNPDEDNDDD